MYINAHGPAWYTYIVARLAGSSPFREAQLHARDLELAMHVADTQMFWEHTYNGRPRKNPAPGDFTLHLACALLDGCEHHDATPKP